MSPPGELADGPAPSAPGDPAGPPTFRQALGYWLRLGWINFGGPAGQIALMHRDLVERRRWIDEASFLHALDVCMLLPGPEAQQLATYIGWRLHGTRGGIVAGAFFVLPSILLLLLLSWLYVAFGHVPAVVAVLAGVKPVVLAIVLAAVVRLGRRALRSLLDAALAAGALVAVAALGVPFPALVALAVLVGFLAAGGSATGPGAEAPRQSWPSPRRLARLAAAGLALWIVPATALRLGGEDFALRLYLFFTQAAFVTFGGAYAVLAYVASFSTAQGWLTREAMIDGLALAETTPGPLIVILLFVGFVAGWQHGAPNASLVAAVIAALATTWATFLPSTLLGLAVGPYVERFGRERRLRRALAAVTAAVVGVIASLGLMLGRAVIFGAPSGFDLFAALVAAGTFALLVRGRVEAHWAVVGGALIGLLRSAR